MSPAGPSHLITQWEKGDMSLEQRLQACRANADQGIPRDELLPYMEQAAKGLDFVNGKGIVHRDVKPENLLLFQGQVKLIDFGFARLAEIASATNSVFGTPVFAPAEASDGRLNPSVDIFCLAGTYVRLRTGKFPFGTGDDLKHRKQAGQFHTAGLLPHEIAALRGALDPDPKQRAYATAGDIVAALSVEPPPVTSGPAPSVRPSVKPLAAAKRRSFADKIRLIVAKEQTEQQAAAQSEADRQAAFLASSATLLHQQFDVQNYSLAYGTVNFLLRSDPKNAEYLEVRKFLEQPDKQGRPRAEDAFGGRFALIPPGEFLMGSPADEEGHREDEYQHRVRITQPFYMGLHPVTVGQFKRFVDATRHKTKASWRNPGFAQDDRHPVVNVWYDDVVAFCQAIEKISGNRYHLPTEAQWEYAARAGTTTPYWCGNSIDPQHATFHPTHKGTTPVDKYPPNPFGLFDVHGNVWEQCRGYYDAQYYYDSPVDDPPGPAKASSPVLRGGGWINDGEFCRSASRSGFTPGGRGGGYGFRLAAVQAPVQ